MSRFAVLVGNSRYPMAEALADLRCPARDVDGLEKALSAPHVGFTEVVVVKDVAHHQALREIHRVLKKAKREDVVLVYYSGHGKLDAANRLHLCSVDTEINALEATAIPVQSIKNFIDTAETRKVGLILDCCFSGAAGGVFAKGGVDDQLNQISRGRGVYVLAASTAIQPAVEKEGDDYSVFTKHLIGGIESGVADSNADGSITMDELYDYVHRRVLDEGAQEPMKWSVNVQGEFVLADATGKSPRREERNRLRKKLLELATEGLLPDRVLTAAMKQISVHGRPEFSTFNRLLDDLLKDAITVGEFVDEWLTESSRVEAERAEPATVGAPPPSTATHPIGPPPTELRQFAAVAPIPFASSIPKLRFPTASWHRTALLAGAASVVTGVIAVTALTSGEPEPQVFALGVAPSEIDFEDGSLPPSFFGDWRVTTSQALGSWSLESPPILDNQRTRFDLVLAAGVTFVEFAYFTDTEECCDRLTVALNGSDLEPSGLVSQGRWSFQRYTFPSLSEGSVVSWEYRKDHSESIGQDRVWIDNIRSGNAGSTAGVVLERIGFEDGLPPPSLVGEWELTSSDASSGSWSIASSPVDDSETSYFELSVPPEALAVEFDYRTDSESCCDHLTVLVDGREMEPAGLISEGAWRSQTYFFSPDGGATTVRWEYRKDSSESVGADRVWVDEIRFTM